VPEQRGVVAGLSAHGGESEARMAQLIAQQISVGARLFCSPNLAALDCYYF
jgi:hypothetical protein